MCPQGDPEVGTACGQAAPQSALGPRPSRPPQGGPEARRRGSACVPAEAPVSRGTRPATVLQFGGEAGSSSGRGRWWKIPAASQLPAYFMLGES